LGQAKLHDSPAHKQKIPGRLQKLIIRFGFRRAVTRGHVYRRDRGTGAGRILALAWYNFACGAAVAGRHDEAIKYLNQAVDNGFEVTVESIASDPDLKSLRGNLTFEALLAKMRQGTAAK
jgi:hypothetical protein